MLMLVRWLEFLLKDVSIIVRCLDLCEDSVWVLEEKKVWS